MNDLQSDKIRTEFLLRKQTFKLVFLRSPSTENIKRAGKRKMETETDKDRTTEKGMKKPRRTSYGVEEIFL